jgi:hypothetical protein
MKQGRRQGDDNLNENNSAWRRPWRLVGPVRGPNPESASAFLLSD